MAQDIRIKLPTFHAGQVRIWNRRGKRNAVRCGRRFGKTVSIRVLACDAAAKGKAVGIFTPEIQQYNEIWSEVVKCLSPIISTRNKNEKQIKTTTGGVVDFWHINDNELAGRGREYDIILIDEAAFAKKEQAIRIWHECIIPTTATKPNATFWVFSTPKGINPDNFFWVVCNDPKEGFVNHHAPSWINPTVSKEWVEEQRSILPPLVFSQEIEANFVDWSGVAFFSMDKWMENGSPVQYPPHCDTVFAVIDSAVKTGSDNDGTAVIYCARNKFYGTPLTILDYDLIQIEADLLTTWVPNVVMPRLAELAKQCGARMGDGRIYVEDKASGTVLLQRGQRMGWPTVAIDSKFTALGKDERAIAVSGHHHQGLCKISQYAFDKTVNYKGATRNHLVSQVAGFRLGDKDAAKRADDSYDTYAYCLGLTFGYEGSY